MKILIILLLSLQLVNSSNIKIAKTEPIIDVEYLKNIEKEYHKNFQNKELYSENIENKFLSLLKKFKPYETINFYYIYKILFEIYPEDTDYKKKFNYYKNELSYERSVENFINYQFNKDGSHKETIKEIKKTIPHPETYKNIKTVHYIKSEPNNEIEVINIFRYQNDFGGHTIEKVTINCMVNKNLCYDGISEIIKFEK